MAAEIFSNAWAHAWCGKINHNDAYRKAAANWEGAMVLAMAADAGWGIDKDRAVIADLWHGACRSGHLATLEDMDGAPYVIRATPSVWNDVLDGRVDPIFGLMRGKLKLAKGGLFSLLPYAVAAKELVVSARGVVTSFPVGWQR
jgi:putative sterol carrier protein